MRLIDADALNKAIEDLDYVDCDAVMDLITNASTVQREGWVSVEDLQRLYDDMFRHKDIAITANSLFKLINHE